MNLIVDWLSDMDDLRRRFLPYLLLLLAITSGCNSSKFLTENQELLVSQRVEFLDAKSISDRGDLNYDLSSLTLQKPNGNFLFFFPREYFYLANNKSRDSTGLDRFLRNSLGQPPTIYDDSLSMASIETMQDFLRYQGYFNAEVYHEVDRKGKKKVQLTYFARPGKRTIVNSINYSSGQPEVDSLLQIAQANSLLEVGKPLDLNLYNQEKERISRYLRNQGYAFLYNNAFDQLEVDTFQVPGQADIYLKILPPRDEGEHVRYRIGRVEIFPDYSVLTQSGRVNSSNSLGFSIDTTIQGVRFQYRDPNMRISPQTLLDNLFLLPGGYYSKADYDKTNQQLGGLGIFRFVRINQIPDSAEEDLLHYVVQLTPNYKMEFGTNFDLNYSNRNSSVANNLIGITLNPSFRNRNLFGGAELLVTNLRAGIEFDPSLSSANNRFFNTIDLGADASLSLPRFKDIFGLYRMFYGKGNFLLSDRFYNSLVDRANTRVSLGTEYLQILDILAYTQSNIRFGYDLDISATTRYQINHIALDLLIPNTEPDFDTILANNPLLDLSFGSQYLVSGLFRNVEYQRTGRVDRRGRSLNFNVNLETAGLEIYGVNKLVNAIQGREQIFSPGGDASFAQYLQTRFDLRFYKKYNERSNFASRFIFNLARPLGYGETVPFVRQFFAGGANSMRAWAPRGLGPGGFVDSLSLVRAKDRGNLLLYQTGDLQLELNLEYRYKLLWQLKGAFFLDIGNVWTLNYQNDNRCGSQFRFNAKSYDCGESLFHHQAFYRQLAIAAGTGIRVDLSYFIFRLDASVPLRYNYPRIRPEEATIPERLYWNNFADFQFPRSLTWQLGLGYPF